MYEPNSGATPEAAWMMNDPEDGSYLGYEPDDIERIGYGEFERALLLDEGLSSRAQRAKNVPAVEQIRRREGHRMGR